MGSSPPLAEFIQHILLTLYVNLQLRKLFCFTCFEIRQKLGVCKHREAHRQLAHNRFQPFQLSTPSDNFRPSESLFSCTLDQLDARLILKTFGRLGVLPFRHSVSFFTPYESTAAVTSANRALGQSFRFPRLFAGWVFGRLDNTRPILSLPRSFGQLLIG